MIAPGRIIHRTTPGGTPLSRRPDAPEGWPRVGGNAGHEVTELGPEGGDASEADAVLIAVPSGAIDDALSMVTGLEGKVVIDATNDFRGIDEYGPFGGRDESFPSLAHRHRLRSISRWWPG